MHYAILAAGEGSRLGAIAAKPLATIQGQTLVGRLLEMIAARADVQSVVVVANSRKPEIQTYLRTLTLPYALRIVPAETLSAAHSLIKALGAIPEGDPVVVITVDSVFLASEFGAYVEAFVAMSDADALMGVTRFADDEKPLYVEADGAGCIRGFRDFPGAGAEFVSAGIYGLKFRARQALDRAMNIGVNGLREVQRAMLLQGVGVRAHEFSMVYDVDRPQDLLKAREFLMEMEPDGHRRQEQ